MLRLRPAPPPDALIAALASGGAAALPGATPVAGPAVFVCCHARRDKRCGVCGPVRAGGGGWALSLLPHFSPFTLLCMLLILTPLTHAILHPPSLPTHLPTHTHSGPDGGLLLRPQVPPAPRLRPRPRLLPRRRTRICWERARLHGSSRGGECAPRLSSLLPSSPLLRAACHCCASRCGGNRQLRAESKRARASLL